MKGWRLALFRGALVLGAVLGGCVSPPPSWAPRSSTLAEDRLELVTKSIRGRLFVQAKVNGAGPFWFLVDTGAEGLVLAPHVASAAGLSPGVLTSDVTDAHGLTQPAAVVRVKRLSMSDYEIREAWAVVMTEEQSRRRNFGAEHGGVVGIQAFADVRLEMDFARGAVTLAKRGTSSRPETDGIAYRGVSPRVAIRVGEQEVDVLVDTGSDEMLAHPELTRFALRFPPAFEDGFKWALFGYQPVMYSQLADDMRLGPITHRGGIVSKATDGSGARIGVGFFPEWKLVVDQAVKQLWLVGREGVVTTELHGPRDAEGRPVSFGIFWRPEESFLRIEAVNAGGLADQAGLRAGDLVLAIDGVPPIAGEERAEPPAGRLPVESARFDPMQWRVRRGEMELTLTVNRL
jgi:hypothetical protein